MRVKEPELQKDNAVTPAIRVGRSKGEKLFDWLVYGGLAGVATFVLTLIPAYWMRYKGGEAKMGEWLGKAGVKGDLAKNILTTTSLSHGGNLMILPIAYAEARHTQIVDGLNRMTGDPTPVEEIQAKPKPTLGNILGARVLAWMAVFTGFVGANKLFKNTLSTFEHEMGEHFYERFSRTRPVDHSKSTAYRIGTLSALDIFATAAAAILLYMGSHFFARRKEERTYGAADAVRAMPQTLQRTPEKGAAETINQSLPPKPEFAARLLASRQEGTEAGMHTPSI